MGYFDDNPEAKANDGQAADAAREEEETRKRHEDGFRSGDPVDEPSADRDDADTEEDRKEDEADRGNEPVRPDGNPGATDDGNPAGV